MLSQHGVVVEFVEPDCPRSRLQCADVLIARSRGCRDVAAQIADLLHRYPGCAVVVVQLPAGVDRDLAKRIGLHVYSMRVDQCRKWTAKEERRS